MRPSPTPWPERRLAPRRVALAALLALGLSACVTRGTHQEVVQERDRLAARSDELEERVTNLERSKESLDAERVRLAEETEELRNRKQALTREVERLREAEAELAETRAALEQQEAEVDRLRGTYEGLVSDLESEVAAGQIKIERLREGIRLNVSDEILFAPGSAELGAEGEEVLRKVAGQLKGVDQLVEVAGHTDSVPIRGTLQKRYPTNWELAAARAARVARLLESAGVDGDRLVVVSHAEHRPVAPNDTPANRALNRRIEIRLKPGGPGTAASGRAPSAGAGEGAS